MVNQSAAWLPHRARILQRWVHIEWTFDRMTLRLTQSRMSIVPLRSVALVMALTTLITMGGLVGCDSKVSLPNASLPNIVLITLDTTRADHLGCYGYFRDTSPAIDALAQESIVFERCIVPMATTLPTHVSILTATYPSEHGVSSNLQFGGVRFVETSKLRSFASVCREAGYETAAFVSAAPLKNVTGIETGFDFFDQPVGAERRAAATNQAIFQWLNESDHQPFFLWVHYFDPHWPCEAPPPFDSMYKTDDNLEAYLTERQVPDQAPRPVANVVDDARQLTNAYDGEIRYMDDQLDKLMQRLRARSDYGNTVLLIVGDHGEGLCQHGRAAHGETWHEQIRVPFMIRVPGAPPRRVLNVVSAVDTIPTLLGLIQNPSLDLFLSHASGRDVLKASFQATPVFSQDTGYRIKLPDYKYCLTTDQWKYFMIRVGPNSIKEQLYDLSADPFELHDVARIQEQTIRKFRSALFVQLDHQQKRTKALRAGTPAASGPVDPEIIQQLKSLGYAE